MPLEVIPAILVKTRKELIERIKKSLPHVKTVHIDVMDGKFVPNTTVGPADFGELPVNVKYEFHWMVANPEENILRAPHHALHMVHIETVVDWMRVEDAVRRVEGEVGLVINPNTPIEKILPYLPRVNRVLVMSVMPGFDGQKYMSEVEEKIRKIRSLSPTIDIEVDGGINHETAPRAVAAGATKLAAASALFSKPDIKQAMEKLLSGVRGAR